jgi:hypothetical protein
MGLPTTISVPRRCADQGGGDVEVDRQPAPSRLTPLLKNPQTPPNKKGPISRPGPD